MNYEIHFHIAICHKSYLSYQLALQLAVSTCSRGVELLEIFMMITNSSAHISLLKHKAFGFMAMQF